VELNGTGTKLEPNWNQADTTRYLCEAVEQGGDCLGRLNSRGKPLSERHAVFTGCCMCEDCSELRTRITAPQTLAAFERPCYCHSLEATAVA